MALDDPGRAHEGGRAAHRTVDGGSGRGTGIASPIRTAGTCSRRRWDKEIRAFLRRLLRAIRANWPNTEILLRADSSADTPWTRRRLPFERPIEFRSDRDHGNNFGSLRLGK